LRFKNFDKAQKPLLRFFLTIRKSEQVMLLSYAQKQRLIDHFSSAENWQNRFNMAFFMDDAKKGVSRDIANLSRFVNDTGKKIIVTHRTGASLSFEKRDDGSIVIIDESGLSMMVDAGGVHSNWAQLADPHAFLLKNIVEIPGTDIAVHFTDKGDKSLIFGRWDKQVDIPGPLAPITTPLQKGAQIHVATLSEATAQAWGLQATQLMNAVKLVIACDLGIEPRINAQNVPESYTLYTKPRDQSLPARWQRGDEIMAMHIEQKLWRDTTQFEGYNIPLPDNFHTEIDDGGLNVITSLDQREAIWSQGDVYHNVLESGAAPVAMVNANTTPAHLLNLLQNGAMTKDRRGREWSYVLVKTRDTLAIAPKVRGAVKDQFGLSACHCAVITFEQDLCIIAMNTHVLEAASKHRADKQSLLQKLVEEGLEKTDAPAKAPSASVTRLQPRH